MNNVKFEVYKVVRCKFLDGDSKHNLCTRYEGLDRGHNCDIFNGDGVLITNACEKIKVDWVAYLINKPYCAEVWDEGL